MTVTQVDHNSAGVLSVWCSWFIQNNTKEEDGVFPVQAVETVAESSEPLQTRANTSRPKRI